MTLALVYKDDIVKIRTSNSVQVGLKILKEKGTRCSNMHLCFGKDLLHRFIRLHFDRFTPSDRIIQLK